MMTELGSLDKINYSCNYNKHCRTCTRATLPNAIQSVTARRSRIIIIIIIIINNARTLMHSCGDLQVGGGVCKTSMVAASDYGTTTQACLWSYGGGVRSALATADIVEWIGDGEVNWVARAMPCVDSSL